MGYVSLTEDLINKFNELNSRINNSSRFSSNDKNNKKRIMRRLTKDEFNSILEDYRFARRELKESKVILSETEEKIKSFSDRFNDMEAYIKELQNENDSLKRILDEKETLLRFLKNEISKLLIQNENRLKEAKEQNEEKLVSTINQINSTNADTVLNIKTVIGQLSNIINQPSFYKKNENLNNLKLIIKRLNEF